MIGSPPSGEASPEPDGHRTAIRHNGLEPVERIPGPAANPIRGTEIRIEILDDVARAIFLATLRLASARSLTDRYAATDLDQGLDMLDKLIQELRYAACTGRLREGSDLHHLQR